jgi:hypothetical protein
LLQPRRFPRSSDHKFAVSESQDVYYLYRCFLRPDAPTLWITSKRYFLRTGAVDNGIKVYGTARNVTLTLNGEKVSTRQNGQYFIPDGPWENHRKAAPPKDATFSSDNPTTATTLALGFLSDLGQKRQKTTVWGSKRGSMSPAQKSKWLISDPRGLHFVSPTDTLGRGSIMSSIGQCRCEQEKTRRVLPMIKGSATRR